MNQQTDQIEFDAATHTYRLGGIVLPSVTQILRDSGLVDATWFTAASAWRGTVVHQVIQLHDEGDLNEETVDPAVVGYWQAWRRFRAESGFTPELIEQRVIHPTYGYAGTVDRVGVLNSRRVVLDAKSGNVTPAVALQLAAYAEALDGIEGRFAIQLRADGTYSLKEFKDRGDRAVFLAAAAVVNWKRNHA